MGKHLMDLPCRLALAANLRHYRHRAGLSLRQLAERSGVTHVSLCLLEHGRQGCGAGVLVALSRALGVSPNELLGWEGIPCKDGD